MCAVIPIYPRLATPGSLKLFKELEPAIIDFFLGHLGAAVTSFEHIIDLLSNSAVTQQHGVVFVTPCESKSNICFLFGLLWEIRGSLAAK